MPIKTYKPTTPGRRQMTGYDFKSVLTKSWPEKKLTIKLKARGGRNNQGKITAYNRGGGHKRHYRLVDFKQTDKINVNGTVTAVEYDPNRSAYIILVTYQDGEKRYHLAPDKIAVGDSIITSEKAKVKSGNRMKLKNVPPGYEIHNVEMFPNRGGQIIRSAGSAGHVVTIEGPHAHVQLPSGEIRLIDKECYASIGKVSNEDHSNITIGKAGRKRWLGIKPHVRGKAKNPIDHPHGGGEGNTSIGLKYPKTPWGMPALGFKTRKRKKYSDIWILKKRKTKNA